MATRNAGSVTAIIPALNEAQTIADIVCGLSDRGIGRVIVADGGSSDGTAELAREAGATVVVEPRRGYGYACLAGVAAAGDAPVLLFLDGDGAEDLDGAMQVVRCVLEGRAELALGVRMVQKGEAGAQTLLARLGNRICSLWLRLAFGAEIRDFPSLKAIRRDTYERLHPGHRQYGWTAQLLARAARERVPVVEVPVPYRRRAGRSKVSGTPRGALTAGYQMLAAIGREHLAAIVERKSGGSGPGAGTGAPATVIGTLAGMALAVAVLIVVAVWLLLAEGAGIRALIAVWLWLLPALAVLGLAGWLAGKGMSWMKSRMKARRRR